jgi:hypothetical protein
MGIKTTLNGGSGSGRGDNPHYTDIYYHASDMRGDGPGNSQAAFAVRRDDMPALAQRYRDWRTGENKSGTNRFNQSLSPGKARLVALEGTQRYQGGRPKMVKDAYGRPV